MFKILLPAKLLNGLAFANFSLKLLVEYFPSYFGLFFLILLNFFIFLFTFPIIMGLI